MCQFLVCIFSYILVKDRYAELEAKDYKMDRHFIILSWKFKISKILNFRESEVQTWCMPPKYQKFHI